MHAFPLYQYWCTRHITPCFIFVFFFTFSETITPIEFPTPIATVPPVYRTRRIQGQHLPAVEVLIKPMAICSYEPPPPWFLCRNTRRAGVRSIDAHGAAFKALHGAIAPLGNIFVVGLNIFAPSSVVCPQILGCRRGIKLQRSSPSRLLVGLLPLLLLLLLLIAQNDVCGRVFCRFPVVYGFGQTKRRGVKN